MRNLRKGSSATGYGLLVGLIAITALLAIQGSGESVRSLFGSVAGNIDGLAGTVEGNGLTTPLDVSSQYPAPGAGDGSEGDLPEITFSRAVAAASGADLQSDITLTCGSAAVSFVAQINASSLLLVPSPGLTGGETCTVTIPASVIVATDDGAEFAGTSWSFGVIETIGTQAWGQNNNGQIGNGATGGQSNLAVPVSGGHDFIFISAGQSHACGLASGGTAYCWGYNGQGQLGVGDKVNRNEPVAVLGGHSFAHISAGIFHTCGVDTGGAAWCWGSDAYGRLGNGTSSSADQTSPSAVQGGISFSRVYAAYNHSCGLASNGAAWCWGRDEVGQQGNGGSVTADQPSPNAVSGGHSFTHLSTDNSHTCGIASGGAALCWGYNAHGQLGQGSLTGNQSAPVSVAGGLSFKDIATGYTSTCAVTIGGAGYCWGDDGNGLLGNGPSPSTQQTAPSAIADGHNFDHIDVGQDHACGQDSSGTVWCWGDNSYGQMGDGSGSGSYVSPSAISGGMSFSQVSAGGNFNLARP